MKRVCVHSVNLKESLMGHKKLTKAIRGQWEVWWGRKLEGELYFVAAVIFSFLQA